MEYYSAIKRTIDTYNNMNNLKYKFSVKKPDSKGYILYDSIYVTWWKGKL